MWGLLHCCSSQQHGGGAEACQWLSPFLLSPFNVGEGGIVCCAEGLVATCADFPWKTIFLPLLDFPWTGFPPCFPFPLQRHD